MEQVRVAVLGLGFAGYLHYSSYQSLGETAKLVAICDPNEERLGQHAEISGVEPHTDYRRLLERKDIDAIDICLPHHLHTDVAVEAAQAGKHILMEKPIATTVEDADRMIRAARDANVTLMVAENHLFVPAHRKVKQILDSGVIGKVFLVRAFEGVISELTLNPNPDDWRNLPHNQGVLLDMGVHKFALLRWLLGDLDSVFAIKDKLVVKDSAPTYDDTALITTKFRSGVVGEIVVTAGVPGGETNALEIYGTDGTILENHAWTRPVKYMTRKTSPSIGVWVYPAKWHRPKVEHGIFPEYYNISFRNEVKHFVECVLENKRPDMTGEDGREALRASIAAAESASTGRMVKVRSRA
ncbi:MAG: Gfo/Idh/MocA family oxidoreductase [Actinomycetota bacterium]